MEPRPQRPRTQIGPPQGRSQGQPGPGASDQQPPQGGRSGPGEYGEGTDPATFIAPSRTDYDYSPLDLAPPGQRRRRQFVAATVGGLTVLLLGAIAVFGYLLLRDEPADSDQSDLIAAQTEAAELRATAAAAETIVAQAAAQQTAVAQGPGATSATPPVVATEPPSGAAGAPTAGATQAPTEAPADAANTAQTPEELAALLPEADAAPAGLDTAADSELDQAGVVEALGGGRPAEQNLETWGWTGNAQRVFSPSDPGALGAEATTFLSASVHGFATPEAAAEALPFFSDILVDGGWAEVEAPDLGDAARMLQTVNEDGSTNVALYIQDGTVLYRIGGSSTGGDPTQDVTDMATSILEA